MRCSRSIQRVCTASSPSIGSRACLCQPRILPPPLPRRLEARILPLFLLFLLLLVATSRLVSQTLVSCRPDPATKCICAEFNLRSVAPLGPCLSLCLSYHLSKKRHELMGMPLLLLVPLSSYSLPSSLSVCHSQFHLFTLPCIIPIYLTNYYILYNILNDAAKDNLSLSALLVICVLENW